MTRFRKSGFLLTLAGTLIGLFLSSLNVHAVTAEEYNNYVADLLLHESHQARNPQPIISYADGENGRLLRSVLSPDRLNLMLDAYTQAVVRGEERTGLLPFLKPLLARYDAAFTQDPRAYETEYLDSIEGIVATAKLGSRMMTQSNSGGAAANATPEQKELWEKVQPLIQTAQKMIVVMQRGVATSLREKVSNKAFSEDGEKRALKIADTLDPR